jgi:hypothetical protein
MENQTMIKDISELKIDQALIKQKQGQTDKVIEKLSDNMAALSKNVITFEGKVTKGFYIACGIALVAIGPTELMGKLLIKFIGG